MKPLLRVLTPGHSLVVRPSTPDIHAEAAAQIMAALQHPLADIRIDAVDVENRVAEGCHHTGDDAFDALLTSSQGTFIPGKAWGDAQWSNCVRREGCTRFNGIEYQPGYLRAIDISYFLRIAKKDFFPVLRWLQTNPSAEIIVYGFCDWSAKNYMDVSSKWHGFLITDPWHKKLFRCQPPYAGSGVLDEAEHFLTTSKDQNVRTLASLEGGRVRLFSDAMNLAYRNAMNASNPVVFRQKTDDCHMAFFAAHELDAVI